MAIESPHPATARRLLDALVAIGAPTVVDPELRPDGLTDADVPHLLGQCRPPWSWRLLRGCTPTRSLRRTWRAWCRDGRDHIADERLVEDVLAHRGQRTAFGWSLDVGEEEAAVRATGRVLVAAQAGRLVLLGEAEQELTEALAELCRAREEESWQTSIPTPTRHQLLHSHL